MKNVINVPVTIIPFETLKLKILALLSGILSDTISSDSTDTQMINSMTDLMKEYLDCQSDAEIIAFFKKNADTIFDPIILPYYEEDSVMVFTELNKNLIPLYKLNDDELNSYGDKVKILEK